MDHDTHLSSGSLFHYTPTFGNLKGILQNGLRPSFSLERIAFSFVDDPTPGEAKLMSQANSWKWVSLRNNNPSDRDAYIAMISFCDIPVHLSHQHAKVYGPYAIGLLKQWAEDVIGLNPVLYMSSKSQLLGSFNILWTRLSMLDSTYFFRPPFKHYSIRPAEEIKSEHANDSLYQLRNYEMVLEICKEISCHVKLYEGPFSHGSYSNMCHRFYDEREWRYLPLDKGGPPIIDSDCPKELRDNFASDLAPLPIDFGFITHLLVQSEDEKYELKSFLMDLQPTGVSQIGLNSIQILRLEDICQEDICTN